jgi:hypothetical protein
MAVEHCYTSDVHGVVGSKRNSRAATGQSYASLYQNVSANTQSSAAFGIRLCTDAGATRKEILAASGALINTVSWVPSNVDRLQGISQVLYGALSDAVVRKHNPAIPHASCAGNQHGRGGSVGRGARYGQAIRYRRRKPLASICISTVCVFVVEVELDALRCTMRTKIPD